MGRPRTSSPLLDTARAMIADASASLVTQASRFRHSFEVAVDAVSPDPEQPRRHIAEDAIAGLAATMEEHGQLQPVLLRRDPAAPSRWILVAGERRWRAALHNGWATLLAIESDGDPQIATIIENLQRVDLSPVEEAEGIRRLIDRKGWNQDRAAEALGRSKAAVSAILHILTLPRPVLDAVLTSELDLPRNALIELSRLPAPERDRLLGRIEQDGLTVKAIRAVRQRRERDQTPRERPSRGRVSAPVHLDVGTLDRARSEIEAVLLHGATIEQAARTSLERLREAADMLLHVAS